ncbi:MAG: hypothetical protein QOG64_2719, partial [Acidimicrobiaceae bacterium]|nr:hypothetical protein [Acidimicrobiaceae bacterium]
TLCELRPARRQALAALVAPSSDLGAITTHDPLPPLDDIDTLIVDGAAGERPASELTAIRQRVEAGASLLSIASGPEPGGFWADLLGSSAGAAAPFGEYFAKPVDRGDPAHQRLPTEFALVDQVRPLEPVGEGVRVVAEVSVAFQDRAVVTERICGRGRVVVTGLGTTDEGLTHPELSRLLRRLLHGSRLGTQSHRPRGLAVIGYGPYGGMGYYHGLAARSVAGLEFVATCDTSAERRKAAEADFPGVRAYATVDELAGDDDVDAVVVATPPAFHAELALAMLRAGKHVACEKPLCLTVAEADELIATARSNGLTLTVNQNRRWDPDFVAVRRAVDAGLLGQVFNIETFVGGFEHPCRAWHSEVSISGGAAYDWGSHHVDWILQLMEGQPRQVVAHGHKRVWHDVTNLDQLRVRMTWADGREAEFFQSDVAAIRRPKFYIQGTAGTLVGEYRPLTLEHVEVGRGYVAETAHHAEAPASLRLARYESGYGLTDTTLPVAPEQRFAFHRNLADHLILGEPLAVTPESVRRVIAVLEAAHRSAGDGGTVETLDLVGQPG